jgi:hypothetical protein
MSIITKELAENIAEKLQAQINEKKNRPHDLAQVYHAGKLITSFGIRHGSKKESGHDHIPHDLHVSPHDARLLGQCPMSRDEWIDKLRKKGLIQD